MPKNLAEDETSDTEETADQIEIDSSTETEEIDWKDKYEGQKKVNTDLERKFKAASEAAAKAKAASELAAKPAEEQELEAARAEARAEATTKANERILRSELKAIATGKLADPTDAALYINLADFTVDDNGDVDSEALNAAITDLLERKPHLGAGRPNRFDGGADQGAKGKGTKLGQLTVADIETMSPEAVNKARREGRFNKVLGIN